MTGSFRPARLAFAPKHRGSASTPDVGSHHVMRTPVRCREWNSRPRTAPTDGPPDFRRGARRLPSRGRTGGHSPCKATGTGSVTGVPQGHGHGTCRHISERNFRLQVRAPLVHQCPLSFEGSPICCCSCVLSLACRPVEARTPPVACTAGQPVTPKTSSCSVCGQVSSPPATTSDPTFHPCTAETLHLQIANCSCRHRFPADPRVVQTRHR